MSCSMLDVSILSLTFGVLYFSLFFIGFTRISTFAVGALMVWKGVEEGCRTVNGRRVQVFDMCKGASVASKQERHFFWYKRIFPSSLELCGPVLTSFDQYTSYGNITSLPNVAEMQEVLYSSIQIESLLVLSSS